MKHEHRTLFLADQLRKLDDANHFEPVRLEWNRDAGAILTLVTLGAFIMTAAVLVKLFVGLDG